MTDLLEKINEMNELLDDIDIKQMTLEELNKTNQNSLYNKFFDYNNIFKEPQNLETDETKYKFLNPSSDGSFWFNSIK